MEGQWGPGPRHPCPHSLTAFSAHTDIAVGAPFDGDGKVFIYHGSSLGVVLKPSQVRGLWDEGVGVGAIRDIATEGRGGGEAARWLTVRTCRCWRARP